MKKIKKIRLRFTCDLCKSLKKRTAECTHKSCHYFPENMTTNEFIRKYPELQLVVVPQRINKNG
jgi:hypothetical protein